MKLQLDAVELALALYKAPREIERVRSRPLPDGMVVLFRCAGADTATLAACTEATAAREKELIEAARFYVQHVLLADDNNPYRVLGLRNGAESAQVKEHHRLLIRYLHPDRSEGTWLDVYAERINKAWAALRTPERRAEIDRYLAAGGAQQGPIADVVVPAFVRAADVAPAAHPGAGRWIAAVAVLVVVAMAGALWFDSLAPQTPDSGDWVAPAPAADDGAPDEPVAPLAEAPPASDVEIPEPPTRIAAADAPTLVGTEPAAAPVSVRTGPESVAMDATPAPAPAPTSTSTSTSTPTPTPAPAPAHAPAPEPQPEPAPAVAREPEPEPVAPPPARVAEPTAVATAAAEATPEPPPRRPAPQPAREPIAVALVEPPAPAAPPVPSPPSRDDVEDVLQRFSSAYARGNLEQFLGLFSTDARGRNGGIETIAADYRTFFADSTIRAIGFQDLQLFNDGPTTVATAQFVARITPRTQFEPVVVQGRIQFDLRRADDRVLIARLLHQERK